MSKEAGVPRSQATEEARKGMGLKIPEKGEILRPGKTRRDIESGATANWLRNRETRRAENRKNAGKNL